MSLIGDNPDMPPAAMPNPFPPATDQDIEPWKIDALKQAPDSASWYAMTVLRLIARIEQQQRRMKILESAVSGLMEGNDD